MTRRHCLRLTTVLSLAGGLFPWEALAARPGRARDYHVCLSPEAVLEDPEFPALLAGAGLSCVWLAGFFYGYQPWPIESMAHAREILRRAGLEVRVVNVPLGHPGDSLGARDGNFPLTPPPHWRLGCGADGKTYAGTSLHAPATEENVQALRRLRAAGFRQFFVDDDFRFARGPGQIGGCFCEEHRARFLRRAGLAPNRWLELLDDVQARRFTGLLRQWVEFACDDLSASFRAQRKAARGELGIMVMYLGAEKAGIRLADYRQVPLRIGELMFDDASFGRLKGKTDELFSALFHRRYCEPEHAYSETTAYPADKLSAANLAAKLTISTIADVRHTVFMSGVTPFPKTHWATLGPAMRRQAQFHAQLAGHRLRGPFKHYWGEASRYCGDDQPFSLCLAAGIPFEVTDRPARDGWTFLADADATAVAEKKLLTRGTRFVCRAPSPAVAAGADACEEALEALFAFKQRIAPGLCDTPFVENAVPAVLAWYPSARAALLWNPGTERTNFSVRCGSRVREVELGPLEAALLPELNPKGP